MPPAPRPRNVFSEKDRFGFIEIEVSTISIIHLSVTADTSFAFKIYTVRDVIQPPIDKNGKCIYCKWQN